MKNEIMNALSWRYATKDFDPSKKLSEENADSILESARLAPSSYGLPVHKIIRVETPEIREKLKAAGFGQTKLTEAPLLLVFAVSVDITEKTVDDFISFAAKERGAKIEDLAGYSDMIKNAGVKPKSAEGRIDWAARQAYLSLGFSLETAALLRVDACPMEGFDAAKFDEILGLPALRLKTVAAAAFGYRKESDIFASMKKVRPGMKDFVIKK